MKVCVISDTHIHPFTSFASGVGTANTRVQNSIAALQQVHQFCKANGIEFLIHAGDLFHARDHQRFPIFNAVFDQLESMSKDLSITLIAGNHDIVDKEGTTSLHAFNSINNIDVITSIRNDPIHHLIFIPYTTEYDTLWDRVVGKIHQPDYCVIGHLDIAGAKVGSAMHISEKGLAPSVFSKFKATLLGHYHKCQQIGENAYYIGSLTPVDFGDKNQDGRFCTLDTDTGEIEWFTIDCPRFIEFTTGPGGCDLSKIQGNYVRVIGEQSPGIVEILKDGGAAAYEFVPKPKEVTSTARIDNIESMNWPELIDRYVSLKKPKALDKDQLVKLGTELLT